MLRRKVFGAVALYAVLTPGFAFAQGPSASAPPPPKPAIYAAPDDVIAKIKEEGIKNSHVMETLSYLSDVIGPRLTASPGMKRANEWTRDTLTKWGIENAHLEAWGPFGRGWTLKKFYAYVGGTTAFPLIAYPKAWSPGTDTLFAAPAPDPKAKKGAAPPAAPASTAYTAEIVHFNPTNEAELAEFKGKLKGKIVLLGAIRPLPAHFTPQGTRSTDKELLDLANAPDPATITRQGFPGGGPGGPRGNFAQQAQFNNARLRFLVDEGAAVIVDGARGDGGTLFVQSATAIPPAPSAAPAANGQPGGFTRPAPPYSKDAVVPVQISIAAEHFNRLVRMIDAGEKPTMTVDLGVEFQDADLNGYNTIAEIPGSDLKDEVVMLGGHLDSWHSGTGATDNGAGCAVMMEAMRIIKTLGLKPRRTIRIALWTGEEEGLLGSRAYVKQHFGYRGDGTTPAFGGGGPNAQPQPLTKLPEYEKFSSYFNIDNGTGKIRGIYEQGNGNVAPIFRKWFEPFKDPKWFGNDIDMSAQTISISNTGGTDHQSFDGIGLPGFQFIQDEIEYSARTHHSNMDVFDRIQADDLKQISTIVAAFVYQAAMMDEKMPKK